MFNWFGDDDGGAGNEQVMSTDLVTHLTTHIKQIGH